MTDRMAVATCVREALEQENAGAFPPTRAVGARGKGTAVTVRGQRTLPAELEEGARRGHEGHTTGKGERALPPLQRLAGQVKRNEGGATGGVDRNGGAFEAERVRNTSRCDASGGTDPDVPLVRIAVSLKETVSVIAGHHTEKDTGGGTAQHCGSNPGTLQNFPGVFEQEALLWIDGDGLACTDVEEFRIESVCVMNEATAADIGLPAGIGIGIEQLLDIPAAMLRERRDAIPPLNEHLPEFFRVADLAGKAAAHRDDRDGVIGWRIFRRSHHSRSARHRCEGRNAGERPRCRRSGNRTRAWTAGGVP
jgi:hypothetical protein